VVGLAGAVILLSGRVRPAPAIENEPADGGGATVDGFRHLRETKEAIDDGFRHVLKSIKPALMALSMFESPLKPWRMASSTLKVPQSHRGWL
jgi:hypothetical protein